MLQYKIAITIYYLISTLLQIKPIEWSCYRSDTLSHV